MMIPWMREKFAERRAKWLARGKRNAAGLSTNSTNASAADSNSLNSVDSSFIANAQSACSDTRSASTQTQPEDEDINAYTFPAANSQTIPIRNVTYSVTTTTQTPTQLYEDPSCNTEFAESLASPSCRNFQANEKTHTNLQESGAEGADGVNGEVGIAELITVRVICPSSRVLRFKVDVTKRLADLKSEVILELSDDPESIQLFAADVRHLNPRYRLFRAEYEGQELNETLTMAQLHVRDNETFLLVPRRNVLQTQLSHVREVIGPNEQVIEMATRYMPSNQPSLPMIDMNEIFQQSNIQYDVRKVLVSLTQASALIIGAGPYAPRLIAMLKQRLINKRAQHNDTLQCLVDMGFKREFAEFALKANNNVYSTTLEWLIQNQSEDSQMDDQVAMGLQRSQSSISPSAIITNEESIENTAALIEIVRIYSHRDVPPSEELVEALTEMGFEEAAVVAALKKTGNNKAAACEWLCGNRTGSLTELRDGLSPDSPILKVILEMPQVQLNLNNPKTFLAFLSILENEQAIRVWRGDTETTSVITHIVQKYHEEKHVLGLNQYYSDR